MSSHILKKIKNQRWIFYWSGNWPLLDAVYENNLAYAKQFKKIAGTRIRARADFCHLNTLTVYHTQEEYERLDTFFRRKFERNPAFLVASARGYRPQVNADLAALRQLHRATRGLSQLSNQQLAQSFLAARRHFVFNSAIDAYDWLMEKIFIPVLAQAIEAKLGARGAPHVAEYVNALITPPKKSVIFRERQMLFSIVKYIKKQALVVRAIKNKKSGAEILQQFPQIQKKITVYLKKFIWMPVLVNSPSSTIESVWKEIVAYVLGEPLVIKAKRLGDNFDPKIIARGKSLQRQLALSVRQKLLVRGLQQMAWLRTEDYVVMSESSYYVIPLYTEIAERLGITYFGLKELIPGEIVNFLKSGKRVSAGQQKNLLKGNASIGLDNEYGRWIGGMAAKIKKIILQDSNSARPRATAGTIFHGTIGNRGRITGRVVVAATPVEASWVTKKDILVVASASASFVPALRQAGGIVSEYGGVTSHPVIIAREFNRPCLVGVKDFFRLVKTGDRVELDALAGTVKII